MEGEGPAEVKVARERVEGRTDGPMRVFLMPVPAGLWGLPDLRVDGVRWSVGNWDRAGSGWYAGNDVPRQMAVAVPAGRHQFEVRAFVYPRVWEE